MTPETEAGKENAARRPAYPLTTEARRKTGATGTPVKMNGGEAWLLPDALCASSLDDLRDRIFDQMVRERAVRLTEVRSAALILLRYNYDVTLPEALALVAGAEPKELTDAVVASPVGPQKNQRRQTYSMWVKASLAANNIDPDHIPQELVHEVLEVLVRTGRTVPADEYCDLARHMRHKLQILNQRDW